MVLEVGHETQRVIEAEAAREGLSVDAYLRRVLLADSLRRHAAWSAEHPGLDAAQTGTQSHAPGSRDEPKLLQRASDAAIEPSLMPR